MKSPEYTRVALKTRTARDEVLASGGRAVGEIVTLQVSGGPKVTWCYVADPEGNVIELQSWAR